MTNHKKTAAAILAGGVAALAITTYSAYFANNVDGFASEDEKQAVWLSYKCKQFKNLTATAYGAGLGIEILSGSIPPEDRAMALEWAGRLANATQDNTIGDFIQTDSSGMCTGWLWEYEKSQEDFNSKYAEFNADVARRSGVFE